MLTRREDESWKGKILAPMWVRGIQTGCGETGEFDSSFQTEDKHEHPFFLSESENASSPGQRLQNIPKGRFDWYFRCTFSLTLFGTAGWILALSFTEATWIPNLFTNPNSIYKLYLQHWGPALGKLKPWRENPIHASSMGLCKKVDDFPISLAIDSDPKTAPRIASWHQCPWNQHPT